MRRLLPFALVALCAAITAPAPSAHPECLAKREDDRTRVRFRTADNVLVRSHEFGRGTTAIVLAHQSQGSLCEWVPYAKRLARQGYRVLAFDFRGHGATPYVPAPKGNQLQRDVIAAVKTVRARGAKRVFVVGSSMGGIAALVAAPNLRVNGVVALSAPAQFMGMDAVRAGPRIKVPVLFVATPRDMDGRFERDARQVHSATASPDKALEIMPGELHGIAMLQASPAIQRLLAAFIRSH